MPVSLLLYAYIARKICSKRSSRSRSVCVSLVCNHRHNPTLMASSLGLDNLIAFVDNNDFQSLGRTSETHPSFYPLLDKFVAFGWEAVEIDGHDSRAAFEAVTSRRRGRPFMVVAKTTKGKGVSYMENVPIWHYRSPSPEEYRRALHELGGENT